MPLADKPYDPPALPTDIDAYQLGLGSPARQYRETFRPERRDYVTIYLRVRRKHWEQLLWQLLSSGIMKMEEMYMPQYLPFWTVGMRIRLKRNYAMGRLIDTMKCRLGITSPGLRFCLDGFFGMINFSDIFGHTTDVCPWMQVSSFSTVDSLKLDNSDSIFISVASIAQIENVLTHCKRRAVDTTASSAADKPLDVITEDGEEGNTIG